MTQCFGCMMMIKMEATQKKKADDLFRLNQHVLIKDTFFEMKKKRRNKVLTRWSEILSVYDLSR